MWRENHSRREETTWRMSSYSAFLKRQAVLGTISSDTALLYVYISHRGKRRGSTIRGREEEDRGCERSKMVTETHGGRGGERQT